MSHTASFTIRALSSEDVPLMEALLTTFGQAFQDVETYSGKRPSTKYLARLLDNKHFIALAVLEIWMVLCRQPSAYLDDCKRTQRRLLAVSSRSFF